MAHTEVMKCCFLLTSVALSSFSLLLPHTSQHTSHFIFLFYPLPLTPTLDPSRSSSFKTAPSILSPSCLIVTQEPDRCDYEDVCLFLRSVHYCFQPPRAQGRVGDWVRWGEEGDRVRVSFTSTLTRHNRKQQRHDCLGLSFTEHSGRKIKLKRYIISSSIFLNIIHRRE